MGEERKRVKSLWNVEAESEADKPEVEENIEIKEGDTIKEVAHKMALRVSKLRFRRRGVRSDPTTVRLPRAGITMSYYGKPGRINGYEIRPKSPATDDTERYEDPENYG